MVVFSCISVEISCLYIHGSLIPIPGPVSVVFSLSTIGFEHSSSPASDGPEEAVPLQDAVGSTHTFQPKSSGYGVEPFQAFGFGAEELFSESLLKELDAFLTMITNCPGDSSKVAVLCPLSGFRVDLCRRRFGHGR